MKRHLLAIILLGSQLVLRAQNGFWEEAKGPYGGNVAVVQTYTNVVYALHEYSVHRSDDYGEHWERVFVTEVDSTDYGEEELVIGASGNFYKIVAYFDGSSSIVRKLFISNNDGQTWTLKNDALPVYRVFEAPSGALIGLDHINDRIYRSVNNGASWQLVHSSFFLTALSSGNINMTPNGRILISPISGDKFVYSENNGASWTEGTPPFFYSNTFLASSGTLLAVNEFGSNQSDLYRSADWGASWDTIHFNLGPNENLNNIVNLNNGKILLSSSSKLFASDDDGLTWNPLSLSAEHIPGFVIQFPLSNGDLLGNNRETLVRSSDEGENWSFSAFGMQNASVTGLEIPNEDGQIAVTRSGLWKTTDRGETWERVLVDTSITFLYTEHPLALINKDSFAVKMGKSIWGSLDGGQSFGNITPPGGLASGNIFATSTGSLFCTTVDGVMKMDDWGSGWSLVMTNVIMVDLELHPSGDFYAMTSPLDLSSQDNDLWRSQDGGQTWEVLNTLAIPKAQRFDLYISKTGTLYVTGYFEHSIKVAISADEAQTWTYKVIPEIYTLGEIAVNDRGQIFTPSVIPVSKVLTSADDGESWYYLPDFSMNPYTSFLAPVLSPDGYLYNIFANGLMLRTKKSTEEGAYIRGQVTRDADLDCSTHDAQEPLKNWVIELEGESTFYNSTNENGRYTFFVDTGNYTVKIVIPQKLWWSLCDTVQEIVATDLFGSDTADFVVLPLANCPLMTVNVAIPQLRRCFSNQVFIEYCNQGTEPADSAWVDVMIDPYLTFISSAQPYEDLGGNTLRFFVGDVLSGECGQFQLTVHVDCDSTIIGQTHCITTHGFPDTLCVAVPSWSGANIEASVTCQDSVLQVKLENTGIAPSQLLDYIIIEDDVVLFSGEKSYAPGESFIMDYPADGSTWRVESNQEPGHPFSYLALAFAEGCGGFNSLGYITQFPINGIEPSWHRMCVENIGSYDPNDKRGFPKGVGSEHNIRPGQTIDYLIRFQNTGTDTAFTVVIRDTLSTFLDPINIRPGASSHPYTWDLSGQGVITFSFNNIMLPDSNVNKLRSHGFVQFSIAPYPDVPLGSVIENDAAIYFDFNQPVITNTSWHTIQKSPLSGTSQPTPKTALLGLEVWPNPFNERTNIHFEKKTSAAYTLKIFDSMGNLVTQKSAVSSDIELIAKHIPTGLYWAEVRDSKGQLVGNGKLAKQ
ncbi:MAG: T9SS type A sorting domain-containing protein [Phycisphaerae bacterium]|nr:T9SS type A sorting domain-containing protein [Saprospiraceae bacterium]